MAPRYEFPMDRNNPNAPSPRVYAVTPSDDDLATALREIRIGGAGTLTVKNARGESVAFGTVNAGDRFPGWFTAVMSTGTTATGIVGWE